MDFPVWVDGRAGRLRERERERDIIILHRSVVHILSLSVFTCMERLVLQSTQLCKIRFHIMRCYNSLCVLTVLYVVRTIGKYHRVEFATASPDSLCSPSL